MATRTLASWALALQYSNLTADVVDSAVKSVYNWAGCAIGGFAQDAPSIALGTTAPFFGGPRTSTVFGSNISFQTDAQIAALVNGIASHIDDYDDTHLETIIHPAGPVASALFAVSEWKAPISGHEFLTSFIAGVEAECKLGLSVYPEHYDVGWHITSTTGSVGAAVAVGKLLGLDLETLQQAIGIAATQVVGMQEFFGSDTKSFHVGRAAQGGMLAALLAQAGYTSSLQGLEAKFGWANVVSTRQNLTEEFATLGLSFEVAKNTFKPFPCGIVIHPTIDGCIQLHDQAVDKGLDVASIASVAARVNPEVLVLTGKMDPQTGLEGKFSVYHAAAVALLFGEATPTQFTDGAVLNSTVAGLRKKVNATTDAAVREDEAYVTAVFTDGTSLEVHVEHALGSIDNPLSVDQLKTKFVDQVAKVLGAERAERAYDAFVNIGNMTDVGKIGSIY
ncbi:MmgE/PrpD family protein [Pleurostoma richardsiae]|uniref:MmgE/PrpD family protein n=1 Tax=Pleurostoma richardsiae TaxID=41990 RepID=A0AA38RLP2_9PEZI|nr:MmgE/PrpD family protein [Pleurostoma richardsiae]